MQGGSLAAAVLAVVVRSSRQAVVADGDDARGASRSLVRTGRLAPTVGLREGACVGAGLGAWGPRQWAVGACWSECVHASNLGCAWRSTFELASARRGFSDGRYRDDLECAWEIDRWGPPQCPDGLDQGDPRVLPATAPPHSIDWPCLGPLNAIKVGVSIQGKKWYHTGYGLDMPPSSNSISNYTSTPTKFTGTSNRPAVYARRTRSGMSGSWKKMSAGLPLVVLLAGGSMFLAKVCEGDRRMCNDFGRPTDFGSS